MFLIAYDWAFVSFEYSKNDLPVATQEESKVVESYGGKVMTAPYVKGISTTEIIRRIMVPIPEKTDW